MRSDRSSMRAHFLYTLLIISKFWGSQVWFSARAMSFFGLSLLSLLSILSLGVLPLGALPLGALPLGVLPLGVLPLGVLPLGILPLGVSPLNVLPLASCRSAPCSWPLALGVSSVSQKCTNQRTLMQPCQNALRRRHVPIGVPWYSPAKTTLEGITYQSAYPGTKNTVIYLCYSTCVIFVVMCACKKAYLICLYTFNFVASQSHLGRSPGLICSGDIKSH